MEKHGWKGVHMRDKPHWGSLGLRSDEVALGCSVGNPPTGRPLSGRPHKQGGSGIPGWNKLCDQWHIVLCFSCWRKGESLLLSWAFHSYTHQSTNLSATVRQVLCWSKDRTRHKEGICFPTQSGNETTERVLHYLLHPARTHSQKLSTEEGRARILSIFLAGSFLLLTLRN